MSGVINNATIKKALIWLGEERRNGRTEPLVQLVQLAAQRFDLGPLDAEFLLRMARSDQDCQIEN